MSLSPGVRLGAYEVVALLGAGGMGEVYRARDTKLNRDVAIKVLLHGFEESPSTGSGHAGVCALVMEQVEGGTSAVVDARLQAVLGRARTFGRLPLARSACHRSHLA
jgi:serine/threonine protein kinase